MIEETKVCNKCGEAKQLPEFRKDRNVCKLCHATHSKNYYETNKSKLLTRQKEYHDNNRESRNSINRKRYAENRDENIRKRKEYYVENRNDIVNKERAKRREFPQKSMLSHAKKRAYENGLEFDITVDDVVVPEFCPVFGTPLRVNDGVRDDNSPTLDRIDNTKGYVKGNVLVISWKANRLKNDADINDIRKILEYMEREASHTRHE